jgi:capsular exopolysaccharide synthesis family protein
MELRDYLRILRAHWLGVVLITAVVVAATALYTFTQDKVYAADASALVQVGAGQDPALASVNDQLARSRALTYVKIAESRATAARVKQELDLPEEPAALVQRIDVEPPADTPTIDLTARAGTPEDARALADAWVAALALEVAEIEDPTGRRTNTAARVTPIEAAALPTTPVSPQPIRNLGLGLVLGLLLGFGYAMVRNVLDRRLRTPEAVEERFDVNVVGVVPSAPILGHGPRDRAQIALAQTPAADEGGAGEAFRKLRTNLTYMDVDNPPRVIVVTSPRPGDGKSTVSMNLAVAIAASGQSVVLVDADLRRPTVATSLGLVEGVGLTDVLVGRIGVEDALQQSDVDENLAILAAGRVPPNPSELLGSKAMGSLVAELAEKSMVILDAPPLLPVTDAAVLTARADGALVVISARQTVDSELGTALGHLEAVNGRALGVIFNKVPRKGADAGYYAGYYSGGYADDASTSTRGTGRWRRRTAGAKSSERPAEPVDERP